MNPKGKRMQFTKNAHNWIIRNGGEHVESRYETEVYRLGNATVTVEPEQEHKEVYSVFTRFDEHNRLTGTLNKKYNYHSVNCDWKQLYDYLKSVKEEA